MPSQYETCNPDTQLLGQRCSTGHALGRLCRVVGVDDECGEWQAVLALAASLTSKKRAADSTLTGTVIDSGDGVTHVIPVADGFVIGSAIKSVPIAGKDLTLFVQQLMRERGEKVPPEDTLDVARRVKEQHSYVCSDVVRVRLAIASPSPITCSTPTQPCPSTSAPSYPRTA